MAGKCHCWPAAVGDVVRLPGALHCFAAAEVFEVYFLATHNWLGAALLIVFAKLVGVGVTSFIFDVTRDKLLQMAWFRRLYEWMLWLRQRAHDITEPVRERIKQLVWLLKPQRAGRFVRRLMRLRRRAYQRVA